MDIYRKWNILLSKFISFAKHPDASMLESLRFMMIDSSRLPLVISLQKSYSFSIFLCAACNYSTPKFASHLLPQVSGSPLQHL